MRTLLAVMLLSVLLTGSIFQTYEHSVEPDGDSVVVKEMDTGLFLGMLGDGAGEKIENACSLDPTLECSFSDGTLKMMEEFSTSENYYSFEVGYGLPYIEYELIVKKIPIEKFSERLDNILLAAGLVNETAGSYGDAMNLLDSEENRESASFMRESGLDISYVAVMPGEIVEAYAGGASGTINGSRAEFLLSDVLYESQPVVVRSREINWGYIVLIAAIIVLAAFALSFRKIKKG